MNYKWIYNSDIIFIQELAYNQDNSQTEIILDKCHKLILEAFERFSEHYPPEKRTGIVVKSLKDLEIDWDNHFNKILVERKDINVVKVFQYCMAKIRNKFQNNTYTTRIYPYSEKFSLLNNESGLQSFLSIDEMIFHGLDPFLNKYMMSKKPLNSILQEIVTSFDWSENFDESFEGMSMRDFIIDILYYHWLKKKIDQYSEKYYTYSPSEDIKKEVVDGVKTAKSKLEELLSNPNNSNPTKGHWAIYYYYLQAAGIKPSFPIGKKNQTIATICQENPEFGDTSNFQKNYNLFQESKKAGLTRGDLTAIEYVVNLLSDYPKAENLAKEDIVKILNSKK